MRKVSRKSLLAMEEEDRQALLQTLNKTEKDRIRWYWDVWSRPQQRAPGGEWHTWLLLAGRGFGKTRAGAEWVREVARRFPEARIALVASSLGEARRVMVEGESGLLAIAHPEQRPLYESSLRRITWPNGAQAQLYSAAEAESLRGPQHSHAWCDELAKWDSARAEAAWDNLMMGLRLGEHPQVVATTTPRAVALVTRLLAGTEGGSVIRQNSRTTWLASCRQRRAANCGGKSILASTRHSPATRTRSSSGPCHRCAATASCACLNFRRTLPCRPLTMSPIRSRWAAMPW